MNANLEYYKVFYHVAGCGSLTQAAEMMCISQPAVSQAIKQLEKCIGGTLFLRTAKGVKLTPEGEVLYKYVKEGYETISLGEKNADNASKSMGNSIVLTLIASFVLMAIYL